ncbi:MAG: hypothetical protein ABGW50_02095 [Thermococcus sp.]
MVNRYKSALNEVFEFEELDKDLRIQVRTFVTVFRIVVRSVMAGGRYPSTIFSKKKELRKDIFDIVRKYSCFINAHECLKCGTTFSGPKTASRHLKNAHGTELVQDIIAVLKKHGYLDENGERFLRERLLNNPKNITKIPTYRP